MAVDWRAGLAALALIAAPARAVALPVIPLPQVVQTVDGAAGAALGDGTPIVVPRGDREAADVAQWLDAAVRDHLGRHFVRDGAARDGAIRLRRVPGLGAEAYRLDIDSHGATIAATTRQGLFYGATTLWQLLAAKGDAPLAAVHIEDAPRYPWRGLLLDSARHVQSVATIERLIDVMALHKLNRLQWHLTDDQGWRLQIRAYPRLTAIGGWRLDPYGQRYGGFYSQDEVRQVVAYAAARNVTIVPEIEMPGHALAALRAYPDWGFAGVPASAQSDWGVFPSIFAVDPPTLKALETVLDEVMALFPSHTIAIGGDEAQHGQWRAAPAVQARMKALDLPDEAALQGWFTAQIAGYLAAHGRQAIGWDDMLSAGGIPRDAAILSWHSAHDATRALQAGHDVVLATDPVFYFDHIQAAVPDAPPGRWAVVSPSDVYRVEPGQVDGTGGGHLLGVQGELWSEYLRTDAQMLAMAWPRAAALAELGWTQPARRDWDGFAARLPDEYRLLDRWQVPLAPGLRGQRVEPVALRGVKTSQILVSCSNRLLLNLPARDGHPLLVDIMDRCWKTYAELGHGPITVQIAALAFNYQLADDAKAIVLRAPAGTQDELVVRQDRCDGPELARVALGAVPHDGVPVALRVPLAGDPKGAHWLCL